MAQIRVMSDDEGEVTALLETLMPLLRAHPAFVASGTRVLGKRGPGERVVFELLLADQQDPQVTVERTDRPAPGRRGLPRP
ncbi:hypothetical protein SAMN05216483_6802 [Streptomyces sp. 2131.1]|uniref:hypothetical protein n=1 Tax=Streptomyces sp. 2131.1 TaxID=1855346 RepID=UPI000898555A|nr:hypothetical protein [Streptomyces sp. 2131.1]SEE85401.1 hypothetical protein SAMN05216483_6802 [Streptomyces sp. 2131.1]